MTPSDEAPHGAATLQESAPGFDGLFDAIADVIIVRDLDGTIRYASPAVERVLGYRPEELIGVNRAALVHPDDQAAIAGHVERIQQRPGVYEPIEYRVRHKDGSWRSMEGTAT